MNAIGVTDLAEWVWLGLMLLFALVGGAIWAVLQARRMRKAAEEEHEYLRAELDESRRHVEREEEHMARVEQLLERIARALERRSEN
jgi:uncharacterized membrane-anchored protein YhcB (DUF1043 family)